MIWVCLKLGSAPKLQSGLERIWKNRWYALAVTDLQTDPFIVNDDVRIFAKKQNYSSFSSKHPFHLSIMRVNAWLSEFQMVSQCVKEHSKLIKWTSLHQCLDRYTLKYPDSEGWYFYLVKAIYQLQESSGDSSRASCFPLLTQKKACL